MRRNGTGFRGGVGGVADSELDIMGVRQTIPLNLGSPAKASEIHVLLQVARQAPVCIEYPMRFDARALSREIIALKAVGSGGVVRASV
ncbi:hypothetical protein NZD89_23125 [Alicyclobacillus fastidiosus]|uniref:Uncharacterized protein n=1 Tax=Alicyclobacillus fastidiosus TaxID=392011 RepID=A0ABY6ZE92_9BACL|nr:hypothetical protein [Alicyclobacillus fastidiosus]WAH41128.1 hypothetical protein NZD89_23125 [Alicyclobacillus fastidiosus]